MRDDLKKALAGPKAEWAAAALWVGVTTLIGCIVWYDRRTGIANEPYGWLIGIVFTVLGGLQLLLWWWRLRQRGKP